LFVAASHRPPAFSQSALLWYFEKSLELPPDGLADGELDEPLEAPPVAPGDVVVPLPDEDGMLDPELPDDPLGVCAAASAGARAMIPTKSASISFCIVTSSRCRSCPQGHS
jgi:hypothetical protein